MSTRRAQVQARRASGGGFLLTETLASFTLSAFVLFGLVSGASVLVRAIERSAAQVQDVDDLGRTLDALSRDVANIKRARWPGEEPQPFVFRGGPNSLFFVLGRPGAADRVVALREIQVGDAPTLMRSEAVLPADARSFADLRFGPARPVPTGPARLHFFFAPALRSGVPEPARVDRWPEGVTLPAAVIVEVVEAGTGRLIVTDRLALGADADIGCVVSRGTGKSDSKSDGAGYGAAAGGAGAVWPPPSGLDALSMSPGGSAGSSAGTGTGAAAAVPAALMRQPARPPEPDFCGRADRDDKPDGSGPRPPRSPPAQTAAAP